MEYTILSTRKVVDTYFTTVEFDFVTFKETTEIPHNINNNESGEDFKQKIKQNIKNVADAILDREKRTNNLVNFDESIMEIGVIKSLE